MDLANGSSLHVDAEKLNKDGYVMLERIFEPQQMEAFIQLLARALQTGNVPSILQSRGQTYGSRNLLEVCPEVLNLLASTRLRQFAFDILGPDAGVVRVLFFDKPPDRSWSLPWHRDRTIAVKRNDLASELFHKATIKAGVPHVEAPVSLLENMLTLRVHVDSMTKSNGPLCVIPGSHLDVTKDLQIHEPQELHAEAGDVMAMRPLISHSSTLSQPETAAHRRIVHFELAGQRVLPDGYEWHTFVALNQLVLQGSQGNVPRQRGRVE